MIDSISSKLTSLIKSNDSKISEEKAEIINYGIKLIIYEVFVLTLIITISILLDILKYVLIAGVVFGVLRISAGGSHSKSRLECAVEYSFFIFGTVYLSKYLKIDNLWIPAILLIINLITFWLYAPGDTVEKPILSRKYRKRQKTISLILMLIAFLAACYLWSYDMVISNIIIISTIPVAFLLSPPGYKLTRCEKSGYRPEVQ